MLYFPKNLLLRRVNNEKLTLNIHLVLTGLQGGHNFYCKQSMNPGLRPPSSPGQLCGYGTRRERLVEQQARFVCVPRFRIVIILVTGGPYLIPNTEAVRYMSFCASVNFKGFVNVNVINFTSAKKTNNSNSTHKQSSFS